MRDHHTTRELATIRRMLEELTRIVRNSGAQTMSALDDVLAAIDTATTTIGSAIDSEGQAVAAVGADIAALQTQLQAAPTVTQAVLDRLGLAATKLQSSAQTIVAQTVTLNAMAQSPTNPVPGVVIPSVATPTP